MTRQRVAANALPPEVIEKIRADIARWRPGLWAEESLVLGPACLCGANFRNKWIPEGLQNYRGEVYRACPRHSTSSSAA